MHPVNTPLEVIGKFFEISFGSVALGLLAGGLCTLMSKFFRFISHSAVAESALLLAWAVLAYLVSEMLEMSAICSLLVTSLVYGHYTWYNLSP